MLNQMRRTGRLWIVISTRENDKLNVDAIEYICWNNIRGMNSALV